MMIKRDQFNCRGRLKIESTFISGEDNCIKLKNKKKLKKEKMCKAKTNLRSGKEDFTERRNSTHRGGDKRHNPKREKQESIFPIVQF
jgi:hypothetical protein